MSAPSLYTFPDNASITQIERQRTINLDQSQFLGSRYMPLTEENADTVLWEIRDDVQGLTFVRGADEPYPLTQDSGAKRFLVTPGRYGEMRVLPEDKVERYRRLGTWGEPINLSEELGRVMSEIAYKEVMTIEYVRWQLMALGSVSIANKDGIPIKIASYNVNSFVPAIAWTNTSTATPLNDLRLLRDSATGNGHDFGFKSEAVATSQTWSKVFGNTNPGDIYGKRGAALSNVLGIKSFNASIAPDEDVAQLVNYNGTYKDNTGSAQKFIPDGYVVVVGYHLAGLGNIAGNYVMTRNGSNPNGDPGVYAEIGLKAEPPRTPWVARGHNGAPKINYTKQIVVMKVY